MTLTVLRRSFGAVAVFGALALVAACSGTSGPSLLSPTGPSGSLRSSTPDAVYTPFPSELPPPDPCAPTIAAEGFTTNPGDPVPPPPCGRGRFTGGGFQINDNDVKVTRGFTLHCDAILSNNFEVNWAGGNNFHIDKNPTDVRCSLVGEPAPPAAPVNRIDITGTGKLNGVPGAIVTLVLIDNGERNGAPADQAYIEINGVALTNGSVAVPAAIDGGNIQAHFDQPHKDH
jgi:hypothetical protein